jgi:multiple sugar transport system substrate-binding protein
MPSTGDSDATSDGGSVDADDEAGEYSRRNFMETAAAAGAVGVTAGLAGCSGNGDGGDGNDTDGGDGGDGGSDGTSEQDFLWWTMRGYIPAETEGIKNAASGFEDAADANVNLSTEVITWDSIFQEWEAGIQGQSLPNVSEMAGEHAVDFGFRGAAEPLTDLFNQYDDWYDVINRWQNFQGEQWAVPWFMEVRTTHINRNLMDEAGVDGTFETWEDIVTKGQAIVENTDVAGAWTTPGAQDTTTGQNVSAFNYQAGGQWYGYEDDQWSVEADSAGSLFTHLWVMSMREQWDVAPGGWGSVDSTSNQDLYQSGEVAAAHLPTDLARSLIDPQDGVNEEYADLAEATELTTMPAGPNGENHSFMGGSVFGSFTDEVAQHSAGTEISTNFVDYMTQPENLSEYFPVSAPTFMPVRTGQEEMELYTNNPTELPDSWLETRLSQGPQAVRYGVTGSGRSTPFMGSLEGSTSGYSVAISSMIGNDTDPKEALRSMGNNIRSTINEADYVDQTLEEKTSGPSLDDAPDIVQDWISGDGKPQIWNPYE